MFHLHVHVHAGHYEPMDVSSLPPLWLAYLADPSDSGESGHVMLLLGCKYMYTYILSQIPLLWFLKDQVRPWAFRKAEVLIVGWYTCASMVIGSGAGGCYGDDCHYLIVKTEWEGSLI